MASETPLCDAQAPPEDAPRGRAARRHPLARRALRAARVRAVAGLDRLASQRRAASAAVMPTVRYRDVPAAIAWLSAAFGMEVHRVVAGENGAPRYAELKFGGNLLMIAPIEDTAFGKLMVQPDEIGGVETQLCYLHVEDVAVHYARATAAGAEIVLDIEDEANSGRGYSCRDPEGHVWNFGTYHPWLKQCTASHGARRDRRRERGGLSVLALLLLAALIASDPVAPPAGARTGVALAETPNQEPAAVERHRREAAERAAKELLERQTQVRSAALAAAEKNAAEARSELAEARLALQKAQREAAAARAQAEETRSARQAAERAAEKARASLAAAEKDAKEARAQAAQEQSKRIALEHAAPRTRRRVASVRVVRPRPRVWCYNPNVPIQPSSRAARLSGFCKY
jgi:uncharacterized glyoxalase superfamily protein PhnB